MKKVRKEYRRYLGIGATIIVGIICIIGSYQYYTSYVETVIYDRLWSSVAYSAIQLYLFSSVVDPGEATPLLYEIGKWLAPLCTAYWVFKAAESVFRHNVLVMKRRFSSQKQIMIFGHNGTSELFMENLKKENGHPFIILAAQGDLEKEKRLNLERNGILVYQTDILGQNTLEQEESLKKLCLRKVDEIVLFYEDATLNFTLLKLLTEWAGESGIHQGQEKDKKRCCSVWCEDSTMKKIIIDYYDSRTGRKPWNLQIFDMPDMTAVELFKREPLYGNCLTWNLANYEKTDDNTLNGRKFLETMPQPHVLIVGFGRYGQAILRHTLLTGMVSCCSKVRKHDKLRVTIIDDNAGRCREIVEAAYPRIDKMCRITYIDSDIGSGSIEKKLFELPQITYIAICFSEQTLCVKAMEKIRSYLSTSEVHEKGREDMKLDVPIAVRMKTDGAVIEYWNGQNGGTESSHVFPFGDNEWILTRENVMQYKLEEEAKEFHRRYVGIQDCILTYGEKKEEEEKDREELWNKLNYELKESCRVQVLNKPYFQELIKLFGELPGKEEILSLEKKEFLQRLLLSPSLDSLAALEHGRWCNFCYTTGYAGYHPDPGEKRKIHMVKEGDKLYHGKVHNCLIDSWDEMKADERVNGTVVYDACSVYGYGED